MESIKWSDHPLDEPKERVRQASTEEEATLIDGLDRGYDAAVQFAILSGCRLAEIVPQDVRATNPQRQGLLWTRGDFFSRQRMPHKINGSEASGNLWAAGG